MSHRNDNRYGGMQTHVVVSDKLVTAVLGADYATPRVKPRGAPRKKRASKFDDNVILEVRRLAEQQIMRPRHIVETLRAMGHDINTNQVAAWTLYQTRAHLVPTANAQPYLPTATQP